MPPAFSPLSRRTAAYVRALVQDKGARDGESSFVVEGPKVIRELLTKSPSRLRYLVSTSDWAQAHLSDIGATPILVCSRSMLERLTGTSTPQTVLAVAHIPIWNESALLAKSQYLAVYGEELQDPTNVGTLLRSAAAFGIDGVWLSPGSADPYNPKVVRASAGAILKMPVFSETSLTSLGKHSTAIYAADSNKADGTPLHAILTRPPRLTLAFGNEGRGLSEELRALAVVRYFIPTKPSVESLNVAVSAAIALYHFSSTAVAGDRSG